MWMQKKISPLLLSHHCSHIFHTRSHNPEEKEKHHNEWSTTFLQEKKKENKHGEKTKKWKQCLPAGQFNRHLLRVSLCHPLDVCNKLFILYSRLVFCLFQMAHRYPTDTVNQHSERWTDFCRVFMQAVLIYPTDDAFINQRWWICDLKTETSRNDESTNHQLCYILNKWLIVWVFLDTWRQQKQAVNTTFR